MSWGQEKATLGNLRDTQVNFPLAACLLVVHKYKRLLKYHRDKIKRARNTELPMESPEFINIHQVHVWSPRFDLFFLAYCQISFNVLSNMSPCFFKAFFGNLWFWCYRLLWIFPSMEKRFRESSWFNIWNVEFGVKERTRIKVSLSCWKLLMTLC